MDDPFIRRTLTLAAGVSEPIEITGHYYRVLSATDTVEVGIDQGSTYELEVGIGVPVPGGFKQLRLYNPTAGSITVTVAVGIAAIDDDRQTLTGTVAVKGGGAGFTDTEVTVGVTATLILAANANRTSAIIRAGAAGVFLGGAGMSAGTAGLETIGAGQSLTIAHTGAVYAIRSSGSSPVAVYEETA